MRDLSKEETGLATVWPDDGCIGDDEQNMLGHGAASRSISNCHASVVQCGRRRRVDISKRNGNRRLAGDPMSQTTAEIIGPSLTRESLGKIDALGMMPVCTCFARRVKSYSEKTNERAGQNSSMICTVHGVVFAVWVLPAKKFVMPGLVPGIHVLRSA
jgi:hypothetical protein